MKYTEIKTQVIDMADNQRAQYGQFFTNEIARALGIAEAQVVHILEKAGYIH